MLQASEFKTTYRNEEKYRASAKHAVLWLIFPFELDIENHLISQRTSYFNEIKAVTFNKKDTDQYFQKLFEKFNWLYFIYVSGLLGRGRA